ncbi:WS/DGAT domain-containing protein [Listeria ilorinensis]|uniref:WS/DGAT domain-containing protein n=1 Tax=Listeria ilorinensis TaxID=2867439 RepID=UPI001EF6164F|nr:WS/DGAT domain-containing protein [Listeria ilorinensis]
MSKIQIFPAESSDIKHYISAQNHKNDHHLHFYMHLAKPLDWTALKKAIMSLEKVLPQLFSHFKESASGAWWQESVFAASDVLFYEETESLDAAIQQALVRKLSTENGPQFRVTVIRHQEEEHLVFILNHMLADGGGFKELLYHLADHYRLFLDDPNAIIKETAGSRSLKEVFGHFQLLDKWKIMTDTQENKATDIHNPILPLHGDDLQPVILTKTISAAHFSYLKAYAKQRGATINDLLFASFTRTLYRRTDAALVDIDCPLDLRKYLSKPAGIANFTANLLCTMPDQQNETFEETLHTVHQQFDRQKDSLKPLHIYYLLDMIHHVFPYPSFKKWMAKLYDIPTTSLTNIGIIDHQRLNFGTNDVLSCFMNGSLKYAPYFQVAATTFRDELTLSTNLHATASEQKWLEEFLEDMICEFPH